MGEENMLTLKLQLLSSSLEYALPMIRAIGPRCHTVQTEIGRYVSALQPADDAIVLSDRLVSASHAILTIEPANRVKRGKQSIPAAF
eukprot:52993-Eustigmatos_ZCMA.PRE.1